MEWKKLGTKIAEAAPLLGNLIGGPTAAAAGSVINLIAIALGVDPSAASPDEIDAIISRNPETLSKLRKFETGTKPSCKSGSSKASTILKSNPQEPFDDLVI
jgi:hypothetical protein